MQGAYQRQDVASLQAQLLDLRQGLFTAASAAPTSLDLLQAHRDTLATTHAALLRELAARRAAEAYALAQASEAEQQAYLTTNRAALLAERDRLQTQYAQLAAQAQVRAEA